MSISLLIKFGEMQKEDDGLFFVNEMSNYGLFLH